MNYVVLVLSLLSSAGLGLMVWLVRHNRRYAPRLEQTPLPLATPKVSVLIPARNEAENLQHTLPMLLQNSYPDWELLVLDDCSQDQTSAVVQSWIPRSYGRLRLLQGEALPVGWNGKNWACAQLAQQAQGDILIFCDADVFVGSRVLEHTVSMMQHRGAGALTVIPHQQLNTWAEQAIVPLVMHFPTLGWVPLRMAASSLRTSLTVANGQWLAFSRPVYEIIGGHTAVRAAIVEDMALCQRVKQHGSRVVTALAFSQLSVRMYQSFHAVREGFGKNLFGLTQFRLPLFFGVFGIFMLVTVFPWLLPLMVGTGWLFSPMWSESLHSVLWVGWLPLGMLLWLRIELAQLAGHPTISLVLHPLGSLLLLGIACESLWRTLTHRLFWKDRPLVRPADKQDVAQQKIT